MKTKDLQAADPTICPHCAKPMDKWMPSDISSWGTEPQYVCFNDECSYYKGGWAWMQKKFQLELSYRHRYNPETGETGPLPVYSETCLKSGIVVDEDETKSNQEAKDNE